MVATEKTYYNYLYAHPLTGNIFYVGKGCKDRLNEHLKSVKKHKLPNKYNYLLYKEINSILSENMEPIILQIAEFKDNKMAYGNEIILIQKYKDKGYFLCNLTKGGEGFSSEEVSKQMKIRWQDKGYKEKRSVKVSKQLKERWANPNYKIEVSKKISAGLTNNPLAKNNGIKRWQNPEYREKMGSMIKNKWEDADYIEKMKKRNEKTFTKEYAQKMSIRTKEWWAERKAKTL